MINFLARIILKLLKILDFILKKMNKTLLSHSLYENLRNTYTIHQINFEKVAFQTFNSQLYFRSKTLFTKEPETIDWINKFENKNDNIFWDIGSNIGLYSVYASKAKDKIKVFSFEPSTKNLNILSNNISKNKLEERVKIIQLPLTEIKNQILKMSEKNSIEGSASNSFGVDYTFGGKKFDFQNNYYLFGTSIDNLIEEKILEVPDYIKIDVDGIEHLILNGAKNTLQNQKIKSILIEVQEDFEEQFEGIKKILNENKFHLSSKNQSERYRNHPKFKYSYNYIYYR
jgi:FkbM family methyltransferase